MKRSLKLLLRLLAFTCISSVMSLIPIKRWLSLDLCCTQFSLNLCHSAGDVQRADSKVLQRWRQYINLCIRDVTFILFRGQRQSVEMQWLWNTHVMQRCFIFLYGNALNSICSITRVESAHLFMMLLICRKKYKIFFVDKVWLSSFDLQETFFCVSNSAEP